MSFRILCITRVRILCTVPKIIKISSLLTELYKSNGWHLLKHDVEIETKIADSYQLHMQYSESHSYQLHMQYSESHSYQLHMHYIVVHIPHEYALQ